MITDSKFVSTIRKALTHMNAHTNAHVHTTTHACTCNAQKYPCTFTHTTPHTHYTMCTQIGVCPLYIASENGHDRIVEILLQAKATVDLQDKVENCSSVTCDVPCGLFIVN